MTINFEQFYPAWAKAIAGVSLAVPQHEYAAESKHFGQICVRRSAPNRSILHAQVEFASAKGQEWVAFCVTDWQRPMASSTWEDAHCQHWRSLIVEDRLLARPELVIELDNAIEASIPEARRAAVHELRDRFQHIFSVQARNSWDPIVCDRCSKARADAVKAAYLGRNSAPRWSLTERRQSCQHAAPAGQGLFELCRRHPELAFELMGWLVPAKVSPRDLAEDEQAQAPEERITEARFVLAPHVMTSILGYWLLRLSPQQWNPYTNSYGTAYRSRKSQRRVSRAINLPPAAPDGVSPEERAAIAFSADAWGLTASADELAAAWTAPQTTLGTLPRIDIDSVQATKAVARVLPEVVPVQRAAGRGSAGRGSAGHAKARKRK